MPIAHPSPARPPVLAQYVQEGRAVIIRQPGYSPAEFALASSQQAAAAIVAALVRTPGELTLKNPGGQFQFSGLDICEGRRVIAHARNPVAALRAVSALNHMGGSHE